MPMKPTQLAPHLHQVLFGFVNAYAVTTPEDDWVLVDTGLKTNFASLQNLDTHFGRPPLAIVLTHGHFDHAGNAGELASRWGVKIYVHHLERPFLTGQSMYPPSDPTVGGPLAQMTRVIPNALFNLTGQLETLPEDGILPPLPAWKLIETPGHTPGHISLWNEDERILIAGDALATADFDSYLGMATKKQKLSLGGSPFTPDWEAARASVHKLADLEAVVVAAGHGKLMSGADLPQQMRDFAHTFTPPQQGRYVENPARFSEKGVTFLPPKPQDNFGRNAAKIAGAAAVVMLGAKLISRRKAD